MKKFSILICTRDRVKSLNKSLKSISKNTKFKKNIEVLIAIDDDDINTIKFIKRIKQKFNFIIKNVISSRGYGYRDNPKRLKSLIKISSGKFFIFFADDMIIDTKNWDIELQNQINKLSKDKLYLLTTRHDKGNKDWPLCQVISREWYNITMKFANCYETDTELMMIATNIDRYYICKKIKIKHDPSGRKDKTFKEGRALLLEKKIYKGSTNSLKGFFGILKDLHRIKIKVYNLQTLGVIISCFKILFYTSIKIIIKFKINLLRNFY